MGGLIACPTKRNRGLPGCGVMKTSGPLTNLSISIGSANGRMRTNFLVFEPRIVRSEATFRVEKATAINVSFNDGGAYICCGRSGGNTAPIRFRGCHSMLIKRRGGSPGTVTRGGRLLFFAGCPSNGKRAGS